MATIKLVPGAYTLSSTTYLTISDAANMYTDTGSTTYSTITHNRNSTTAYYLYIHNFNFSDVPSNAEVSSFTIKIKALESGLSTSSSYRMSLYNNTTSIGSTTVSSSLSTTATTFTFPNGSLTWSTLKDYGNDFRIRVPLRRNSQNTSGYVRVYGAEIEVTYTVPVYHNITTSTNSGTITPSGTTSVLEGSNFSLTINGIDNPTVTDNNVNVTSQLVQVTGGSTTLIPNGYTNGTNAFTLTNIANAYTDATSNTSATLTVPAGGTARIIYLELDTAAIPSTATINSVTCSATFQFSRNNSSSGFTASCRLYTGNTAKGSATTIVSSATDLAKTTFNLTPGTWTASEIANARLYITATNSASSTQRLLYIYGVSFNVTYTVNGKVYTYTINNITSDHNIVVTTGATVDVTGVSLDKATASIEVDGTITLTETVSPSNATDKTVSWSSSNNSIATVSNGIVTGIATGTATITVTTVDGSFTATCTITVTPVVLTEYVLANSLEPGKSYLVANGNSGSVYLMSNEANGSRTLKGVAVTVTNNKISIRSTVEEKCLFDCILFTANNNITTTLESNGNYLYSDSATGLRFQSTSSLDRFWHYQDNKFWQFKNSSSNGYTDTSSEYKYYLEWDNSGNFTDNHLTSPSVQDTTIPTVYLFVKDDGTISDTTLYVKQNGTWTTYTKAYIKVNGSWVQQNDLSAIFNSTTHYIKGN